MASEQSLKQQAADQVLTYIQSGMIVGLGHGSTATLAVRGLADKLARGELTDIRGIPCSRAIELEARRLGIPLTTLEDHVPGPTGHVIDLTFDGADEVDPALDLIKGGGGALLHEKIVALASRREIIIVDESKLSPVLGTHWALPVEVIPFGWRTQAAYLESLGAQVCLRPGAFGRVGEANATPCRTAVRPHLGAALGCGGRSRACPLWGVVRAVSALHFARARASRHLQGSRGTPAVRGFHEL